MTKVSVAVIVDHESISDWQLQSIIESSDLIDIKLILSCKNSPPRQVKFDNLGYYGFAYIYAQCAERALVPLPDNWVEPMQFDSNIDGMWQSVPDEVLDMVNTQGVDVIIKFGMGLLRVPSGLDDIPILSFHHGDPAYYRGRPAVFYEMLNNENYVGIIVQRLSNVLDSGAVLAFAEAQVVPYSFKKTITNVYTASKYLLKRAILSHVSNTTIKITPTKKLYKLPSNKCVIKLGLKLGIRFVNKILHASFYDRCWKVAISRQAIDLFADNKLSLGKSHILAESNEYSFQADPFFCPRGEFLRFEGMSKKTGLGELAQVPISLDADSHLVMRGPHLSYPISYTEDNLEFLIPEMSALSRQEKFTIENGVVVASEILNEFDGMAIKDPTILNHNGNSYCFFSEGKTANFVLHLWVDEDKMGGFKPHPASPICISPGNARMGGNIVFTDGNLFRFGQCCRTVYGESLAIMKIEILSPTQYSESKIGSVVTDLGLGPHTLNFNLSSGQIAFDFFTFKFNIFAWIARVSGIIRSYGTAGRRIKFGFGDE
jgi:hypothetical protein